jgi:hypothetical protein
MNIYLWIKLKTPSKNDARIPPLFSPKKYKMGLKNRNFLCILGLFLFFGRIFIEEKRNSKKKINIKSIYYSK